MKILFIFFFFNDTATTEIYTLSLHDALPISRARRRRLPLSRGLRSADRGPRDGERLTDGSGGPARAQGARGRLRRAVRARRFHFDLSYSLRPGLYVLSSRNWFMPWCRPSVLSCH